MNSSRWRGLLTIIAVFSGALPVLGTFHLGTSAYYLGGASYEDGFGFALRGGYFIAPEHSVELELNYFDENGSEGGVDAEVDYLTAFLQYRYVREVSDWLDIYGGVGVGVSTIEAEAEANQTLLDAEGEGFAWQLFAGVLIKATEQVSVLAGVRVFDIVDAELDTTIEDLPSVTGDPDPAGIFELGVLFRF